MKEIGKEIGSDKLPISLPISFICAKQRATGLLQCGLPGIS
jgi:hypothetical protein